MKMMGIPVGVGTHGTIPKGLVNELGDFEIGQVVTIQTTVVLRLARILRGALEKSDDLLSLKLQ